MNLSVSSTNNTAFQARRLPSMETQIKRREAFYDIKNDSVEVLRDKIMKQKESLQAEKKYWRGLDFINNYREERIVQATIDRMEIELDSMMKVFAKKLKAKMGKSIG